MLWYRSWLETRWRFLSGLALLTLSAIGVVLTYRQLSALLPVLPATIDADSALGRRILENAALSREFRGYVWIQWFRQNLSNLWTLFAIVLGTAGLLSQTSAAIFTLSLPVTRRQIVGIRAATGILEIVALAVLPSLAIALLAPAIGQRYAVADALVHGVCLALGGAVFFSLAFLLSTVWSDVWRPALAALGAAIVLGLCEEVSSAAARYGIFHVMSAEEYFRAGHVPWTGLAITLSLSAVMLYGAARNIERRDF